MGFGFGGWGGGGRPSKYADLKINSLAVIGGAMPASEEKWNKMGQSVARMIQNQKWTMVYCGMDTGLSGFISQKVLKGGGSVRAVVVEGYIPPSIPETVQQVVVDNFHERNRQIHEQSDAFLILPGGIGSLAEFSEMAAMHGVGLIKKPVVLFDPDGWYKPILNFYQQAKDQGVSNVSIDSMFEQADTIAKVKKFLTRREL